MLAQCAQPASSTLTAAPFSMVPATVKSYSKFRAELGRTLDVMQQGAVNLLKNIQNNIKVLEK